MISEVELPSARLDYAPGNADVALGGGALPTVARYEAAQEPPTGLDDPAGDIIRVAIGAFSLLERGWSRHTPRPRPSGAPVTSSARQGAETAAGPAPDLRRVSRDRQDETS